MLTRRTLILAKNEVTLGSGIDSVPTALLNSLLVSNCTVAPQSEMLERDLYLSTLSQLGTVTGIYWGQMTFDTELRGMGTVPTASAPLREDPLFLCCGLSAKYGAGSAVYSPISEFNTPPVSATLYAYLDGLLHVMVGSMGNMQMAGTVGQYGKFTWTIQGAVGVITYPTPAMPMSLEGIRDAAFPLPANIAYQSFNTRPPALLDAATTIMGSTTDCIQAINFNMNNNVVRRDCMDEPSGIHGFMITGRKPGGTVNPEASLRTLPSNDYWGKWKNNQGGLIGFTAAQGGATAPVAGNQVIWAMPNSQISRLGYGDRNGIRTFEVEYTANMQTSGGDDEVLITYK